MISDLKQEALRIARHLGIDITDAFALDLAEKGALDQQIKRIQDFDYQHRGIRLGENLTIDPETLLLSNHMCSGRCGPWKNVLSLPEVTFIEV